MCDNLVGNVADDIVDVIDIDIPEKLEMIGDITKKEYFKNYSKKYVENSENVICECGGKYKAYQMSIHKNTKKHKSHFLNMNNDVLINNIIINIIIDDINNLLNQYIK